MPVPVSEFLYENPHAKNTQLITHNAQLSSGKIPAAAGENPTPVPVFVERWTLDVGRWTLSVLILQISGACAGGRADNGGRLLAGAHRRRRRSGPRQAARTLAPVPQVLPAPVAGDARAGAVRQELANGSMSARQCVCDILDALAQHKATRDDIWRFARLCRMAQVMRPYLAMTR